MTQLNAHRVQYFGSLVEYHGRVFKAYGPNGRGTYRLAGRVSSPETHPDLHNVNRSSFILLDIATYSD